METAQAGQTKRCTECGEVKELEEFSRWSYSRDGRSCRCRVCASAQGRERRATDPEYRERERARRRERYRERLATDPEYRERERARWRERLADPETRERERARWRERLADPETPIRRLARDARKRARGRGLDFDPDISDLLPPPTNCPVLGIPIDYSTGKGLRPDSPSIDRIDNSRGYVRGNRIVVSQRANELKRDATVAELRAVAGFYSRLSAQSSLCG